MADSIQHILNRLPRFAGHAGLRITELSGGITNRNYKIELDHEIYVLRIGGNETIHLGIDRRVEYGCTLAASRVGVAPEPIAFLEPEGYLVTRFVAGVGIPAEQIADAGTIRRVVASLKLYHALEQFPGQFSPFRVVETYEDTARRFGVSLPANMNRFLNLSREIETALRRDPFTPRPCHNDLLNGNFIDDGTRIRILDWEYGGLGDGFFDLGNFAAPHDFTPDQEELLLRAYFGIDDLGRDDPAGRLYGPRRARLKLMRVMSDLREAMWAMVQAGVSKLDFDYAGYGQKYFDRVEAAVSGAQYQNALAEF